MRILQLNAWTGRVKGAILKFIKEGNFDIICLQEAVWTEDEGNKLEYFFASVRQIKEASGLEYEAKASNWHCNIGISENSDRFEQGNVILSRFPIEEVEINELSGDYNQPFFEYLEEDKRLYTTVKVKLENGLTILNYHGYWLPTPVGDEKTVELMKKAVMPIKGLTGPVVMCGDLNVVYESPAMRETDFLRDLTHEYGVKNTLAKLKFDGDVACDHILVNDKITVKDFKVYDEKIVSDHYALIAEIEI